MKKDINEDDIYQAPKTHKSGEITKTFGSKWNTEKQTNQKPSLLKVIFQVFGLSVLSFGFIGTATKVVSRFVFIFIVFIIIRNDYNPTCAQEVEGTKDLK